LPSSQRISRGLNARALRCKDDILSHRFSPIVPKRKNHPATKKLKQVALLAQKLQFCGNIPFQNETEY
jgi:hypothetical protein